MGEEAWRDFVVVAAARLLAAAVLPQPDGMLTAAPGRPSPPPDGYRYDPADPTPAVGGVRMVGTAPAGSTTPRWRPGRTCSPTPRAPLDSDLEVIGEVSAQIWFCSSCPYADVFVRLCDVDPGGKSWNVCDGLTSLAAADQVTAADVRLWPTATGSRPATGSGSRCPAVPSRGTPATPAPASRARPRPAWCPPTSPSTTTRSTRRRSSSRSGRLSRQARQARARSARSAGASRTGTRPRSGLLAQYPDRDSRSPSPSRALSEARTAFIDSRSPWANTSARPASQGPASTASARSWGSRPGWGRCSQTTLTPSGTFASRYSPGSDVSR